MLRLWSWVLRGGSGLRGRSHRRGLSGDSLSSYVLRNLTMGQASKDGFKKSGRRISDLL